MIFGDEFGFIRGSDDDRPYATLQHGMSIQAHDGATRDTLLSIARCAMAAWDSLVLPKRSDEMDGSSRPGAESAR
jgi:hypothetical protein